MNLEGQIDAQHCVFFTIFCLLLLYRNENYFSILTLYPLVLLNSILNFNHLSVDPLEFSMFINIFFFPNVIFKKI